MENLTANIAGEKGRLVAAPPSGPQHPFWRNWTGEGSPQQADGDLIARLLNSAPNRPPATQEPIEEVVVLDAVELGDGIDLGLDRAPQSHVPHLVSLPIDHRRSPRVIRLHEPHLNRPLTENDKFAHWRRWMVASKRKELAR